MRFLQPLTAFALTLLLSIMACAQNVRIISPQEGQDVRGEFTVRFEGIPTGGYAIVRIDGQFKRATAQEFVVFNTIADRATFNKGRPPSQSDGTYKLDLTVLAAGGGRVGTASVTFNVANSREDVAGEAVPLAHWTNQDRINNQVQRFRVFAESNATIQDAKSSRAGANSANNANSAGSNAEAGYIPAPLDYQFAAMMRRMVRDINVYSGSASIVTIIQEAFERGREGGESGAGASSEQAGQSRTKKAPLTPSKGPWLPLWTKSNETGKSFVKMIEPSGREINPTRRETGVAITDLLPSFPDAAVRPGSTWETTMSIMGDLSSRLPINVQAPITFTAYDTILTSAGESRRCAKLESRFRLPDNLAKKIAANLANQSGVKAKGSGIEALKPAGKDSTAVAGLTLEDIEVARTEVNRVVWFDIDRRQIVRSEDTIRSFFELPNTGGATGAVAGAGEVATAADPTKVTYNLSVTTWLDDRMPGVNESYTGGLGTAHGSDSVTEPGLSRLRGGR